jgi:Domain of unknown function (DUF4157)
LAAPENVTIGKPGDRHEIEADRVADRVTRMRESSGSARVENPRAVMGSYFGEDFSSVKIHTDAHAAQMSEGLGAQAYTIGRDIFFNSGAFDPSSAAGARLLAHELAHVVQHRRGDVPPNTIQRYIKSKPTQVDCAKAITAAYDCTRLIGDMIAIAYDQRDNERWLTECELNRKPGDLEACKERTQRKVELQQKYDEREAVRAACCPTREVPPEAPMAPPMPVPAPAPQPTQPEAPSTPK